MKKLLRLLALLSLPLLLSACLEVEQHPGWKQGYYNGKPDNLVQHVLFHDDRMAWYAAINDRNRRQNEYNRMRP
jgi:hypothetical protein